MKFVEILRDIIQAIYHVSDRSLPDDPSGLQYSDEETT